MSEEPKRGVEAEGEPNFLLAPLERRFLPWLAGVLLVGRALANLRELASQEPAAPRR